MDEFEAACQRLATNHQATLGDACWISATDLDGVLPRYRDRVAAILAARLAEEVAGHDPQPGDTYSVQWRSSGPVVTKRFDP